MGVFVSVSCVGTSQFALGCDLGAVCSWTDENDLYLPFWHHIEHFLYFACLSLFPRPTDYRTFFFFALVLFFFFVMVLYFLEF